MTAFCLVRWRFPCGLLPISMIDIQRPGPLSVPLSGLNSQRHVAPFDRLTNSSPCSEAARNGDHKAL